MKIQTVNNMPEGMGKKCMAFIEGGILTLGSGETIDIALLQADCNEIFQDSGDNRVAEIADKLSAITGAIQGPHGDWLNANDDAPDDCKGSSAPSASIVTEKLMATLKNMKREIINLVKHGIVPVQVASFGDLHDYIDANELGGFCDDAIADPLIEFFGGRQPDEELPIGYQNFVDKAQTAVDQWLKMDGLNMAVEELGKDEMPGPKVIGELIIAKKKAERNLEKLRNPLSHS